MVRKHLDRKLLEAAGAGDLGMVVELVGAGALAGGNDALSETPLHAAAFRGHLPVVEFLVGKGAPVDMEESWGRQPLYMAAWGGQVEVVRFLVERGAPLDEVDHWGWPPLCGAVHAGHLQVVEFLLEAGANPVAKAKDGSTLMDVAEKHPEIRALLQKWSDPEFRKGKVAETFADARRIVRKLGSLRPKAPGM